MQKMDILRFGVTFLFYLNFCDKKTKHVAFFLYLCDVF